MAIQHNRSRYNSAKLSDDQVYLVLISTTLTENQLAAMVGVSSSSIQKLRRGESYAHLFPEVIRIKNRRPIKGPRCTDCVHNIGIRCTLSFPERKDQGSRAAAQCASYTTKKVVCG